MDALTQIPPLKLDRSRQSAPQVFEALRALIVAMALTPGTVLPRAELAEHYGLSQTPIRDALLRLGDEGLVDIFPQHATVVSRIDITAALQTHFLRRAIELEVLHALGGLPAEALAALVQRLQAWLLRQQAALEPLDVPALAAADQGFHREMYAAVGMDALWTLVRQHSGHVDRLRHLNLPAAGKAQAIVQDHGHITQALATGDVAGAQAELRRHLSGTLSFVDEVARQYPAWVV